MLMFLKRYKQEVIASSFFIALAALSACFSPQDDWYNMLLKPSFTPSPWVFPIVWTTLYVLLGIAFVELLKEKNILGIGLFILQMCLNFAWSPIFFYWHSIEWAWRILATLWCLVFILFCLCRDNKFLFHLMIPYIGWLTLALLLNRSILDLNAVSILYR